jgi:hypothetical protein
MSWVLNYFDFNNLTRWALSLLFLTSFGFLIIFFGLISLNDLNKVADVINFKRKLQIKN